MAKPKQPPSYDLKKQEHRRSQLIQIGLTAVVVVFAVALVGFIVLKNQKPPAPPAGEVKSIQLVTSGPAKLITESGTNQAKVVMTLAEDPLCPICGEFEKSFGPTVTKLVNTGAVQIDYYMLGMLDDPQIKRDYSSRASAAAYCVADQSSEIFAKFHKALYVNQPDETAATWPDDAALIRMAKHVGANDATVKCIQDKKYLNLVKGLTSSLKAQGFWGTGQPGTPTIKINGQNWEFIKPNKSGIKDPSELVKTVTAITGPVPGL